jgi:AraC family transcriptional regulator
MASNLTTNASRREYASRLNRVLDHIDQHLADPLELATLAEVAHFSPYHFHRLFAAWMGETLGEYLRRRRLEIAAQRLAANAQLPVLNVALEVGFGSGEAFARAFKERFDCTPTRGSVGPRSLRSAARSTAMWIRLRASRIRQTMPRPLMMMAPPTHFRRSP